ncbi:MAG: hypothetical protein HQL84_00575 [Magnetococcales bacterium]|nr:hypothetical protein [Magnetococcales bacterium]MBF0148522.1 hypothetical protein [Magnetococcales bacterium]
MTTQPEQHWREHLERAAKAFIRTAVVIDNEAVLSTEPPFKSASNQGGEHSHEHFSQQAAIPDDDGFGERVDDDGIIMDEGEDSGGSGRNDRAGNGNGDDVKGDHQLDLRSMSEAFAKHGIVCGMMLPHMEGCAADIPGFVNRAVEFSLHADVVIVDWKLHEDKTGVDRASQQIIVKLLRKDQSNKGRLRLICVYTGDPVQDDPSRDTISSGLRGILEASGINSEVGTFEHWDGIGPYIKGPHYLIAIVKKDRGTTPGISEEGLPDFLVHAFTYIIDGMLPAFSVAAVAAIRENVHYVLSDFSADLDRAYIANRAISDPPGDVAEMMRKLLLAEFDGVVSAAGVTDTYLGVDALEKWCGVQSRFRDDTGIKTKNVQSTEELIKGLFRVGGAGEKGGDFQIKAEKRKRISYCLHQSDADSVMMEARFARMCHNKRERYGRNHTRDGWLPSLGFGTILKTIERDPQDPADQYLLCVTPACDTIRLQGSTRMAFLELRHVGSISPTNSGIKDKFNLILVCDDTDHQVAFMLEPRFEHVRVLAFDPRNGQISAQGDGDGFVFIEQNKKRWRWIGELRPERVQHELHNLTSHWSRIGIDQSEWLRLSGK